jgi:hypothetical protein
MPRHTSESKCPSQDDTIISKGKDILSSYRQPAQITARIYTLKPPRSSAITCKEDRAVIARDPTLFRANKLHAIQPMVFIS